MANGSAAMVRRGRRFESVSGFMEGRPTCRSHSSPCRSTRPRAAGAGDPPRVRRCRPPTPKPRAPATEKPFAGHAPPVRLSRAAESHRRGLRPCRWPIPASRNAAAATDDQSRCRMPRTRRAPENRAGAGSGRSWPGTPTTRASRDHPNPVEAPRRERRSFGGWDTACRMRHACARTRS